jgi:predicted DNA repair protein MutK
MAFGSLLALLDDISTLLDDVAVLTKVAAKKSAGVLGDDLALNAQQVTGVSAARELPVVWAVAKGSLLNKAILVPAALAISRFAPWAVTPLLMLGGLFLCYEAAEKLAHRFWPGPHADPHHALPAAGQDPVQEEKAKIKGAVRTDFILSAEIIAITLGAVAGQDFVTQAGVMVGIALLMTVGVYGLVAGIVKLDDGGLWLSRRQGTGAAPARALGRGILRVAPWLMKFLSVAGTAAMLLVGGGILVHGVGVLHHGIEHLAEGAGNRLVSALLPSLGNMVVGLAAGAVVLLLVMGWQRLRRGGMPQRA